MQVPDLIEVAARSAIVYLVLLGLLRLAGKRHAGQLSPHDLVLILLISNAVQNAMVGANISLVGGLAASAVLVLLNLLISRFVLRHRRLLRLLAGEPTLLIHNGVVLANNLEREGILPEELEAQIRAHGFESTDQIKTAVQECDGSISVIGFGTHWEMRLPPPQRQTPDTVL